MKFNFEKIYADLKKAKTQVFLVPKESDVHLFSQNLSYVAGQKDSSREKDKPRSNFYAKL